MRMLVSVEFPDAGAKSGTHRVLIIGRGTERPEAGDIGLRILLHLRATVPPHL
jgi:hypothetical protein